MTLGTVSSGELLCVLCLSVLSFPGTQRRPGSGNTGLEVWCHGPGWWPARGWFWKTVECVEGRPIAQRTSTKHRGWPSHVSASSGPNQERTDWGLESWLSEYLRALVTKESQDSIPSIHTGGSHPSVTPFQGPNGLFWSLKAPGVHMAHRHICRQNTLTHKVKLSLLGSCSTHFSPST